MGHYVNTVRLAVGDRLARGTTPRRGKGYKVATHFLHLLDYIDSDDVFGGIGGIDPIDSSFESNVNQRLVSGRESKACNLSSFASAVSSVSKPAGRRPSSR